MKAFTEKQKQWLWFACLWLAGLLATATLAQVFRWIFSLGRGI